MELHTLVHSGRVMVAIVCFSNPGDEAEMISAIDDQTASTTALRAQLEEYAMQVKDLNYENRRLTARGECFFFFFFFFCY